MPCALSSKSQPDSRGLDRAIQGSSRNGLLAALIAQRLDGRIKCGHDRVEMWGEA
jgi:hypothetical protein